MTSIDLIRSLMMNRFTSCRIERKNFLPVRPLRGSIPRYNFTKRACLNNMRNRFTCQQPGIKKQGCSSDPDGSPETAPLFTIQLSPIHPGFTVAHCPLAIPEPRGGWIHDHTNQPQEGQHLVEQLHHQALGHRRKHIVAIPNSSILLLYRPNLSHASGFPS